MIHSTARGQSGPAPAKGRHDLKRDIFTDDHEIFRASARRFYHEEIVPHREEFEAQGFISRSVWQKAGQMGFLCMTAAEEHGGAGASRHYPVIMLEEAAYAGQSGPGFWVHSDMSSTYISAFGTEEQKARWLPQLARGDKIMAIAMSEPGGGSDLAALRTRAVRDGDDYLISGSKIFISNGWISDVILVVARTDPDAGARGLSLFLVEADMPGFRRGRLLNKIGMKAQDTAELFFDEVRVPKENMIGEVNEGFGYLMAELAWERLLIAVQAMAVTERTISDTTEYTNERTVFGNAVSAYQNTQFKLADFAMEARVGRVFLDHCIARSVARDLDPVTAAMAKAWITEMEGRVLDGCLQLHGGYGYIWDYPVARAFADARSQRIVGGTNEIMRQIISRAMPQIVDGYGL